MRKLCFLASLLFAFAATPSQAQPTEENADIGSNELSYETWIDSNNRFKCLYGYVADKTGDHAAAVRIFEDCIARWNDVYSM